MYVKDGNNIVLEPVTVNQSPIYLKQLVLWKIYVMEAIRGNAVGLPYVM